MFRYIIKIRILLQYIVVKGQFFELIYRMRVEMIMIVIKYLYYVRIFVVYVFFMYMFSEFLISE